MQNETTIFSGIFLMKWDKVLLLKRKSEWHFDGFWGVPGWHLWYGEFLSNSAIRETLEEIGIIVKKENIINQIIVLNQKTQFDKKFIWYYGLCTVREWEPINNEPHKCSKISRYNINSLPSEITPCARNALKALLEDKNYIEL